MTLQSWRKYIAKCRIYFLKWSIPASIGIVFIVAFISSWHLLYLIGGIGLLLWFFFWKALPEPSRPLC